MSDQKKQLELKKHVATIHSSNKLSLVQRKISNALLYNAYEGLLDKEEHVIHIATLCKLIGYDSHDHKTIKKALIDLLSTVLEWNIVDGNKLTQTDAGVWNASSIIADASIDGPICTYSYSNKMKRLLYRPELYGRLNMVVQAKFKSSYGLALYENCIRYQNIGQTPSFDLLKFRKLMGVEEGKYKIFRDFKCRVLDKAVDEVNLYSSIHIKPQVRKQGRQVIAIQFLIASNKKIEMESSNANIEKPPISEILKSRFGFSERQLIDVLTDYQEEYILEKITVVESSAAFQKGNIHNLAKYLFSAIKDDYQLTKSSILTKEKRDGIREQALETSEHIKIINSIKKRYVTFRDRSIDLIIARLDATKKQRFMDSFFEKHADSINTVMRLQRNKYSRENVIESPQIKALLRGFAVEGLSGQCSDIQSIEKFVKQLPESEQQIWEKQRSAFTKCVTDSQEKTGVFG